MSSIVLDDNGDSLDSVIEWAKRVKENWHYSHRVLEGVWRGMVSVEEGRMM